MFAWSTQEECVSYIYQGVAEELDTFCRRLLSRAYVSKQNSDLSKVVILKMFTKSIML